MEWKKLTTFHKQTTLFYHELLLFIVEFYRCFSIEEILILNLVPVLCRPISIPSTFSPGTALFRSPVFLYISLAHTLLNAGHKITCYRFFCTPKECVKVLGVFFVCIQTQQHTNLDTNAHNSNRSRGERLSELQTSEYGSVWMPIL